MRVLLIADSNSIWTLRVCKQIYHPLGCEVLLAAIYPIRPEWRARYEGLGVTLVELPAQLPGVRAIPGLRGWVQRRREARFLLRQGPFDQAHVQGMVASSAALAWLLCKRGLPVLCSYWGSDVFRASEAQLRRQRPLIARALAVAVQSESMRAVLGQAVGEPLCGRLQLVTFGVDMLPELDAALARGKAACREALGLPADKYVVVLGGNASPTQQHERVLAALVALPEAARARLHAVLPLTYNGTAEYVAHVSELAAGCGVPCTVLTRFMDAPETALLRVACDALVQSTTTDAISASMQESLYAGARVLNPAWLAYPELEAMGYVFDEYAGFEALPAALERLMATEPPAQPSRQAFRDAYAWSTTARLYAGLMGLDGKESA